MGDLRDKLTLIVGIVLVGGLAFYIYTLNSQLTDLKEYNVSKIMNHIEFLSIERDSLLSKVEDSKREVEKANKETEKLLSELKKERSNYNKYYERWNKLRLNPNDSSLDGAIERLRKYRAELDDIPS